MSNTASANTGPSKARGQVGRKVVTFLVVAIAAVTVPASAAYANWELCGSTGYHCVYKNNDGADGGVKSFSGNDSDYSDNNYSRCYVNCWVNDSVSSMWNRESYTVRSYVNSGYGGSAIDVSAGHARYSLCCGYNDALSSHRGI
jgi:hypothetical protein